MPQLEDVPAGETLEGSGNDGSDAKRSRSEKKARKALSKFGLKPVSDINRVTIRKQKHMLFVIEKPDVMKTASGDMYIVFGEAKMEDLGVQQQQQQKASNSFQQAQAQSQADSAPVFEEGDDEDDDE